MLNINERNKSDVTSYNNPGNPRNWRMAEKLERFSIDRTLLIK